MWKCKHCNNNFSFKSVSEKANHSRWCNKNPNRKETTSKFSTMNDSTLGKKIDFQVICDTCKKEFFVCEREKSFPSKSKYFCSRGCANSVGGTAKSKKYNTDENASYRTVAWRHHKKICVVCGEDKVVAVHHMNENHSDNSPSNLVPLCPTHHQYMHSKYKHLIIDTVEKYIGR